MALYLRKNKRDSAITVPFVYKWTHIPTQKWYVGSRTAPGCNPSDEYICSSKVVKELVMTDRGNWKREILYIATQSNEALLKEVEILQSLDAKNDPMSFNRHNGDGKFTSTGKEVSLSTKKKMSESRTGVTFTIEHRESLSSAHSKGYYCYGNDKFVSSIVAAKNHGVSDWSVRNWSKNNKNGWSFQPKELV